MDNRKLATLTSRVAIGAVLALLYWMFIFISIQVFGLKIFRENMTQAYYMSIMGILAVLGGAVFLNVMANMSRIADSVSMKYIPSEGTSKISKKWGIIMFISFPIIFGLMVVGDYHSAKIKQDQLIIAAENLVRENSKIFEELTNYEFSRKYLLQASAKIKLISKIDKKFPHVKIVVKDEVEGKSILMGFTQNSETYKENEPSKLDYIYSSTDEERSYIFGALAGENKEIRFTAHDGSYELYYPVVSSGKTLILYLSDYQKYGKGSY